ncbi:protein PTHB1 [Episyrphus balteatus]|uniref:protein PTHB1 n=1 Tax=Episyrphus balteatus TaxID=286459 RepID=UPI002486CB40|nr:protein PTHB1 [Episyrphus balteatus]
MSLFKVRTWWTAQCTDIEENYDIASLLCTRFGLEDTEKDYIVVGSQNGLLSIFYPNPPQFDANHNFEQFHATDLLLECQMKAQILAVLSGRFSGTFSSENTNQLAILHPNNLAIYNLTTVDGVADHGNHSQLQTVVEHTFARTAFSLCKGHFGQVKGREFLCIGHLDGSLTFYEQEGISYECNLPGPRPLPSPLVYVERTDSFLRINSSWHLESFSYQDLSHSAINKSDISPVWSFCLGEGVLDIIPVQVKEASTSIMILGERNLIAVNDHGDVEFILKLEFSPKCFCSFVVGYYWEPDTRLLTAIVSENSKLFIYQDTNLAWAAQLEDIPVALQRSNLHNLPGGIVTLGPTGLLKVSYLGSEQHVFQVPPLNTEEINFERAHKELLQLEDEIKQAIDLGDIDVINQMAENDLALEFRIGPELNECNFEIPQELTSIPMCSGYLKFKSTAALEEIQIAISTPEAIRCSLDTMTYNEVLANTQQELQMQFYLAENLHIETSKVELLVSFINKQGIPRVLTKTGYLPLAMLYKSAPPQKTASLKVTLNINSKSIAPKLSSFFPEFCSTDNDVQALGLSLLQQQESSDDNAIVTIVTAKNSKRIRIQSDSMEALPLVLERIVNRINEVEVKREDAITRKGRKAKKTLLAGGGGGGDDDGSTKAVIAGPNIPFEEILSRMDAHHSIQEDIRKQMALMDALWNQFKLFQRSLQSKVEGEPTDGLLMLIEKNYDDLVTEGDKLVELRCAEKDHRCKLSCALAVAKIMISCLTIGTKISNFTTSILVTPVEDWTELSWEQSMAPGIDMLHHYGPLNRSKSAGTQISNTDISHEQFEYDRFRRHFLTLFERICRLAASVSDTKKLKDIEVEKSNEFTVEEEETERQKEPATSMKIRKHQRLEALEDDEEEDDDGTDLDKRPESDWLNTGSNESSDILANMLLKNNVLVN